MSQLYDVFPEPPAGHPLFDVEAQKRLQQFRDLASSLHQWIKEQIVIMQVCVLSLVFLHLSLIVLVGLGRLRLKPIFFFLGSQLPKHFD